MADEVKRTVTIVGQSQGLDKLAADVDKVTAAQMRAVGSEKSVAVIRDASAKATAGLSAQADRFTRANDDLAKALQKVVSGERLLNAQRSAGLPVTDGFQRALINAKARVEELTKTHDAHTAAIGLNRMQMMESIHVAKSFVDSVIAGQSPLRALAVEGGRIGQIFSEGSGGAGGTLKAMGGIVGRLATGWVGLGTVITTAVIGAGIAVARFEAQQERLATSLNGVGRAAGVSLGGLAGIANAAGARNPALGQGGASDLAATLAGTGRISAGLMPGILDMATPFARGTGQEVAKGGEELAKAFADPVKGAELLNEKLGFLNATTRQHIGDLMAQGNLLGAQQTLMAASADSVKKLTDNTYALTRAWEGFKSVVGGVANAIGSGLAGASTLQDRVRRNIETRDQFAGRPGLTETSTENILQLRRGLIAPASSNADTAAADKLNNDLSLSVQDAIKKAMPEALHENELGNTIKLLTEALKNPDLLSKLPGGVAAAQEALSRSRVEAANASPMLRLQQDSDLAIQGARAQTLAQREVVEARRAELAVLRQSGDELRAAAAAEAKRNEMLAEAQRQITDAMRSSGRELALSTMNPHQRGLAAIQFQVEDLNRATGGGAAGAAAGGGSPSWAGGVNPALVERAERLLAAIPGLTVISGYRDSAKQAELYAQLHGTGHPVAAPGTSLHERGLALDLGGSPEAIARARSVAGQYGLAFPVPGDLNHMQLAAGGAAGGAAGLSTATVRSQLQQAFSNSELQSIKDANKALDAQSAILKIQSSAANSSKFAIEGLLERQKLLNELNSKSVPITGAVIIQLDAYQKRAEDLAKAQDHLAQTIQNSDMIRSDAKDGLHTFVNDLINGKNAATAFKDAMEQLGKKILDAGLDRVVDMLLGKSGTPSLGLFGGATGDASGGAGGILGGILGSLFKFADGGVMTSAGAMPLRRYGDGGVANSPQVAMFGEGSGPEAYVPLRNGGIPVHVKGGGGHTFNIGAPVLNVQGSLDSATLPQVRAMLAEAGRQQMSEFQRNAGQVQAKWSQRYG